VRGEVGELGASRLELLQLFLLVLLLEQQALQLAVVDLQYPSPMHPRAHIAGWW